MGSHLWTPENPAPLDLRVLTRIQLNQARRSREQTDLKAQKQSQEYETLMERIADATADPYRWATGFTKTNNPHWQEEGRQPYEPFPDWPYIRPVFELLCSPEPILWIEKSRDMMVSWICVAFFTWHAMRIPERRVLFQTQKKDKVVELIDYAKCLYREQPDWLKDAFPLAKPLGDQSSFALEFRHGGDIIGIPGGADKIRLYHPWGLFNDESAFQAAAGECHDESISAVKGKLVFNSSAYPGWFADASRDIIRNLDE